MMGWNSGMLELYVNPMHLDPNKGPEPRPLNPDMKWNKPWIRKIARGWECSVVAYLHHGEQVIVSGIHADLNWAWTTMTDNLLRHNMLPTFASTKGPSYMVSE